jgi:hypothetical protein
MAACNSNAVIPAAAKAKSRDPYAPEFQNWRDGFSGNLRFQRVWVPDRPCGPSGMTPNVASDGDSDDLGVQHAGQILGRQPDL